MFFAADSSFSAKFESSFLNSIVYVFYSLNSPINVFTHIFAFLILESGNLQQLEKISYLKLVSCLKLTGLNNTNKFILGKF